MYICEHFKLQELVSPIVYQKYGQFAWNFFDSRFLQDIDLLRKKWGKPLVVNNWEKGGGYKQSGLRCNVDPLVKGKTEPYLSAHCLGRAVDIKPIKLVDCDDLFLCVLDNYKDFQVISRVENINVTGVYVHIDSMIPRAKNITIFNA